MSYKPKEPFSRKATFSQEQEFSRVAVGDCFEDQELPRINLSIPKNRLTASQSNELADSYAKKR
jgi:hypothetical protein